MQFQLITPEKVLFSGDITEVTVPGTDGEFGVLEGHAPTISTLKPGVVTFHTSSGQTHKVAVQGGVAEAIPDRCSVLAEVATSLDGLTKDQLKTQLDEALAKIQHAAGTEEATSAQRQVAMMQAAIEAV